MDLRTGKYEIGMGRVEKNELLEIDMTLEDAAVLIKDPVKFEEFKKVREEETSKEIHKKSPSEKMRKMSEESRKRNRKNFKGVSDAEFDELLKQRRKGKAK